MFGRRQHWHLCEGCGHAWSHRRPPESATSAEYDEAHRCPAKCGDQTVWRWKFNNHLDATTAHQRIVAARAEGRTLHARDVDPDLATIDDLLAGLLADLDEEKENTL